MKTSRMPILSLPSPDGIASVRRGKWGLALLLGAALAAGAPGGDARADVLVHVSDVKVAMPAEGIAEVMIAVTGSPQYTARISDGGRRLVIDLEGADVAGAPGAITKGNAIVGGVMTQAVQQNGLPITRVMVTLLHQAEYRVVVEPGGLRVVLAAAEKTAPMTPRSAQSGKLGKMEKAPEGAAVSNVRFDHQAGVDRVVVELSSRVEYTESTEGGHAVIDLRGVRLPDNLQRKLDTGAFGGPVKSVSTYRRKSDESHVVVEVEKSAEAGSAVTREGNDIVISFGKGKLPTTVSGVGTDGGVARRTHTVAREEDLAAGSPRIETTFDAAAASRESMTEPDQANAFLPTVVGQQRRYTGHRINIDFKDASVHEILRLLADVGHVNIITADNVSGSVTVRMNNVPWDQALEVVLQAKGLGMVRQGNMIRVAPLADLNKERELAIARRKAELQLAPVETRLIPISYADAGHLMERSKDLLSPRGSLAVDERTNTIIARDVMGNLAQIEQLVNALDTMTPQVLIEARIVEATSSYTRDIGIQWGGDGTLSPATGNPTGLAFPSSIGLVGGASDQNTPTAGLSPFTNTVSNPNFAVNLPATVGAGQGGALGITLGSINNTFNLALRLSAAEASGMVRIISSPRILTLDNKDARIGQGTLIPFSQVSAQGVQTTFQEAKLQLLVKPHVTSDGSVAMHLRINRDEPDFNQTAANGAPTILKREAETDLLIMDGHTAVIGGIFTRNTGRNLNSVPLLGDIPVLGVLFQRRRSSDTRGELVIFITPRIVNRAEALGR
jgi:type IV pilus assembly protein PilQ